MAVSWDASELNSLAADLGKVGASAAHKARQAVAKSAADVQRVSQGLAPVDTGALKNSIGFDLRESGLAAEIGPTVHYGAYVEFGTRRMAPHAYMGPALDIVGPSFAAAMEEIGGGL